MWTYDAFYDALEKDCLPLVVGVFHCKPIVWVVRKKLLAVVRDRAGRSGMESAGVIERLDES